MGTVGWTRTKIIVAYIVISSNEQEKGQARTNNHSDRTGEGLVHWLGTSQRVSSLATYRRHLVEFYYLDGRMGPTASKGQQGVMKAATFGTMACSWSSSVNNCLASVTHGEELSTLVNKVRNSAGWGPYFWRPNQTHRSARSPILNCAGQVLAVAYMFMVDNS